MRDKDAIDMMRRCAEEIKGLRKAQDVLGPKAEAYDLINKIMGLVPGLSRGYGEDLVWKLERKIKELEEDQPKDPA